MVLHVHKERQQGRIDHPNSDQKVGCRFQSDLLIFFSNDFEKIIQCKHPKPFNYHLFLCFLTSLSFPPLRVEKTGKSL